MPDSIAFKMTDNTTDVRFLASLSDGRTVIQDEIAGERNAWLRLAAFLKENPSLTITNLRLQAPGMDEVVMPSNQQGYFFGRRVERVHPGGQANYVGIGYYDGSDVSVRWFDTDNMGRSFNETRTKEKAGFFLIESA